MRRQLLLHDAQPRAVVQLDDPLHHRVPRDVVELVVVDLQPVVVDGEEAEEEVRSSQVESAAELARLERSRRELSSRLEKAQEELRAMAPKADLDA